MKIGNKLIILRENKGLAVTELAKILNVSPSTLKSWEEDKTIPRFNKFIEIIDFFNVSADFLLGLDENQSKNRK